ncbi:arabinose efflux permease family protein [Acidovorax sp. CF316]|uniref:MFS transporter n=1 Tax=Acidovorax sp. CF316 TaxID=1144317 RepID=UPI00026BED7D|nr:MFS transporter [Acidovorax sp. CF316]EJE54734.1 arabinose efflux permease family protein [Acidovorax sp. CF316]
MTTTTANPSSSSATPRGVLASLSLAMLLSSLGTSIANVGLPTLAQAFGATFQQVQWVVLAYLLAITTAVVGVGRLGDLWGRQRLLLAGIALFTAASALCALAPSLAWLVAARAVQGLGAAVMMALAMALVADAVPPGRTGSAMGLLGTMSAVGTALGPTLGGALIAGWGWPALFAINLPLGGAAWWAARRYLPADSARAGVQRPRFDVVGMLLLAVTLAAYALAMTLGRGQWGALNAALLAGAGLGLALFIGAQRRAGRHGAAPLVPLGLFLQSPALGAGFAMGALVTTVVMATLVVGPFYLAGALGLGTAQVGLAMSSGPLVSALAGVPAGRLVDRLGTQRTTRAGLIAMAVGSAALALLPAGFGVAGYVLPLALVTAGYALFQAANNTAVMAATVQQPQQRGVVSGLLNLSRNLGLVTGASAMGAVFAWGAGGQGGAMVQPGAVAAGMQATFGVAAALVVAALGIALAARPSFRPGTGRTAEPPAGQ